VSLAANTPCSASPAAFLMLHLDVAVLTDGKYHTPSMCVCVCVCVCVRERERQREREREAVVDELNS
jgi:hypothetical protein